VTAGQNQSIAVSQGGAPAEEQTSSCGMRVQPPSVRRARSAPATPRADVPAVLRVAASGARLRHPRPAPVGDLNPDNAVLRLDRDRLAGSTRAAMPDTVDESSSTSNAATSPHGCPGPSSPCTNARASRARSARPASVTVSRTASPAISAPAFPARPHPGKSRGSASGHTGMDTRLGGKRQARAPPERAPEPRQAATHTAPSPRFPSAMRPWTPQHNALQRYKVTHGETEKKRPASTRIRS
jgi:hypothetical protein